GGTPTYNGAGELRLDEKLDDVLRRLSLVDRQRCSHARRPRGADRMPEELVDEQRYDAAVNSVRRPFVHAGQLDACARTAVLVDVDDQWGCERFDLADDRAVRDKAPSNRLRLHVERRLAWRGCLSWCHCFDGSCRGLDLVV